MYIYTIKIGAFPIKNGDCPFINGYFPINNGDCTCKKNDFPASHVSFRGVV